MFRFTAGGGSVAKRDRDRNEGPRVLRISYTRFAGSAHRVGEEGLTWVPPVDVYETDEHYVLDAELPGVESADVRIQVAGTELIVAGERRFDAVCSEENYHRLEGIRGRFQRTFSLPDPLDEDAITATLHDGVLHVILPKLQRSRKIPINSARASGAGTT